MSDCDSGTVTSAPVVPVVTEVTDVPVSPSSVVTEVCDDFLLGSDEEYVLFFLHTACSPSGNYAGRDEV